MPGENQTEAAAQIALNLNGTNYRVKSVDTSVDVSIEMIYGNNLKPDGWGVTEASFSGSLAFHGDVAGVINPELTDGDGVTPVEGNTLTVTHMSGRADVFQDVLMGNQSYSMSEGEITETQYEWSALDKQ